jgi:hypothetical protein
VVKVCLRGECRNIQLTMGNGVPAKCLIRVEESQNLCLKCGASSETVSQ